MQALDSLNRFLKSHSIALLRISLGLVFFWFGALKIAGASPVYPITRKPRA
jgi:uncharacterized membrane protein YkgB